MDRPTMGDLRGPKNNAPRSVAPAATEPETIPETPAVEGAPENNPEAQLTPAEQYERLLKEAGIEKSYAIGVIDAVFAKGYFEESFTVRGVRGTFRTRLHEDTIRLQKALEVLKPGLAVTQDELVNRYNLAASLIEWNGKTYGYTTEEEFDKQLTVVRRLPAPVLNLLTRELSKFDAKMLIVFSEGVTDSF